MTDLLLQLDPNVGRRISLERALRDAIRSGRLGPGVRLPSSRSLATDHGLSRATVVAAYEQLGIEGYVVARQGVGTIVADLQLPEVRSGRRSRSGPTIPVDFRPGEPDRSLFPRAAWIRSLKRAIGDAPDELFGYGDPRGRPELRWSLADYLSRSRVVHTEPGLVSVFAGVISAVGFLGEALGRLGVTRIGFEDPSLFVLRDVFRLVGLEPVPVPLDSQGICVDRLEALDLDAIVVTPGHQYPTGLTMSAGRRAELIEWAQRRNGWIIEDDYDGEFRYDRQPIGALQGLDPERVIYVGTASKSLAAGLRLSWVISPAEFAPILAGVKHYRGGVSEVNQRALADFIDRGELDRHIRRVRKEYERRQRELRLGLAEIDWLRVPPERAGLHLPVSFVDGEIDEAAVIEKAAEMGIGLMGFGRHWMGEPSIRGLVLGYSRPPTHRFSADLEHLLELLGALY